MAAPAARQAVSTVVRISPAVWVNSSKAASLAEKLDQRREADLSKEAEALAALSEAAKKAPRRQEVVKSFALHLGADLHVPTDDRRDTPKAETPAELAEAKADPFDGLPLRMWAERLGERIMPAYELVKEEQKKAKAAAKQAPPRELSLPQIPHLLPFTRWAANSEQIRDTFVAEEPKTRKRARLSWYHPDDTMVPRDWFKGGLLADIKYYAPFSRRKEAAAE